MATAYTSFTIYLKKALLKELWRISRIELKVLMIIFHEEKISVSYNI
jgi:ribosomal protein S6